MTTLQITVLFALAVGAIGCLLGICKAIQRLSEGIFFIRTELTKINAKLERVEIVNRDDLQKAFGQDETDHVFEAAIDNAFERLKTGLERPRSDKV